MVTLIRAQALANTAPSLVRLRGLNPALRYRVAETGQVFGGDELMLSGLLCPVKQQDAASLLYHLIAEEE